VWHLCSQYRAAGAASCQVRRADPAVAACREPYTRAVEDPSREQLGHTLALQAQQAPVCSDLQTWIQQLGHGPPPMATPLHSTPPSSIHWLCSISVPASHAVMLSKLQGASIDRTSCGEQPLESSGAVRT
jgi:hypothetical protein